INLDRAKFYRPTIPTNVEPCKFHGLQYFHSPTHRRISFKPRRGGRAIGRIRCGFEGGSVAESGSIKKTPPRRSEGAGTASIKDASSVSFHDVGSTALVGTDQSVESDDVRLGFLEEFP